MSTLDRCKCGYGRIEWADQWCQDCWEYLCAESWWEMLDAIGKQSTQEDQPNASQTTK